MCSFVGYSLCWVTWALPSPACVPRQGHSIVPIHPSSQTLSQRLLMAVWLALGALCDSWEWLLKNQGLDHTGWLPRLFAVERIWLWIGCAGFRDLRASFPNRSGGSLL